MSISRRPANTDVPTIRRGDVITANRLNDIVRAVIGCITGGPGILVSRMGNRVTIENVARNVGGAFVIEQVLELPAVPTTPTLVQWVSDSTISGGTGDDQIWAGCPGVARWVPTMLPTDKSGVPV